MSVEVLFLTKLQIAENVCIELQRQEYIDELLPTVVWIQEEINQIRDTIFDSLETDKKKRSVLSVTDRKLKSIYSLKGEVEKKAVELPTEPEKGSDLYLVSVLIFILHDMKKSKKYKSLISPVVTGAYSLEKEATMWNADNIIDYAAEFVERIYNKIELA